MLGLQGQVWIIQHLQRKVLWKVSLNTLDLFASGQGQCSCSRPILGPKEPKCGEEEHRQPKEEEGINAWLSLIAFLRASLDAQNFFYRAFYLGGLWSRQTFCRSICKARLCMMQVRGTTRTPGMILLSSRPMTWPRNQAGVHSDPLEQRDWLCVTVKHLNIVQESKHQVPFRCNCREWCNGFL